MDKARLVEQMSNYSKKTLRYYVIKSAMPLSGEILKNSSEKYDIEKKSIA